MQWNGGTERPGIPGKTGLKTASRSESFCYKGDLNLFGRLLRLVCRIPAVKMHPYSSSGLAGDHRIIMDTLRNGLFINHLPNSLHDITVLLNTNAVPVNTTAFRLHGNSLRLYNKTMTVEFYVIPEIFIPG
jgi:hypothetical protein